jgi:hypothetical protein
VTSENILGVFLALNMNAEILVTCRGEVASLAGIVVVVPPRQHCR